jgi:translation initiation factor IF-3
LARRRSYRRIDTGPTFRRNNRIRVPEVRLIDENGEQVGVVQTPDARRRAQEAGLDLVEVSPNARPPVCKILDYGKFKYEQRKKDKKNKGGSKTSSQLKELRVRPAISDHDLSYRLTDGRKFLIVGHKVQVVCIFRGRQMAHPEHGYDVMKKVATQLEDISKIEAPAKMIGRRMTMLLSPLSTAQRDRAQTQRDNRESSGPAPSPQDPPSAPRPTSGLSPRATPETAAVPRPAPQAAPQAAPQPPNESS